MPFVAPRSVGWLVISVLLFLSGSASAWIETAVRSHQARVEVGRDGVAIVRHELVLKVRGGPMKSLEISGIGQDIEALPDALVRRAIEGSSSKWPLVLSALEDGGIRLAIGAERGIRGGSYLFSFAYTTDLKALGLVVPKKHGFEVSWIGPRLSTGVDSAKVTFVVPRGSTIPELGQADNSGGGVLLGEVRRGSEFDEVELVRAHLATGEPAVWKIEVATDALKGIVLESEEASPKLQSAIGASAPASGRWNFERVPPLGLLCSVLLGILYGSLVYFKGHFVLRAAKLVEARSKPLTPGAPWLRAIVCALLVFSGVWFAVDQEPWIAVTLFVLVLVGATYLLPSREPRPRGPGQWKPLSQSSVNSPLQLPGGIFETTTARGFSFFVILVVPIVYGAYRLLPSSNYLSLMTMILALLLVPIFWTGRLKDLPRSASDQARPWQRFLSRALDPELATVELWGRIPAAGGVADGRTLASDQACDETRLRIVLRDPPPGLRALELSLDEAAGSCVLPCVVVRVLGDSPSQLRLPGEIPWQRGRCAEERVALLRPAAPTRMQVLRLVRSLVNNLRGTARELRSQEGSSKTRRRSSGSLDSARNSGTLSALPLI